MKNKFKCPVCSQKLYFVGSFAMSLDTANTYESKCDGHVFTYCVVEGKDEDKIVYEQLEIKLQEEKLLEVKNIKGHGIRGAFPYSIKITNYLYTSQSTSIFRGLTTKFNDTLTIQDIFLLGLDHSYTLSHLKYFELLHFDFSNLEETLHRAETYYMLS